MDAASSKIRNFFLNNLPTTSTLEKNNLNKKRHFEQIPEENNLRNASPIVPFFLKSANGMPITPLTNPQKSMQKNGRIYQQNLTKPNVFQRTNILSNNRQQQLIMQQQYLMVNRNNQCVSNLKFFYFKICKVFVFFVNYLKKFFFVFLNYNNKSGLIY